MNTETTTSQKNTAWGRVALMSALLILLVGPNFGPLPHLLNQRFGMKWAIIGVLLWFIVAFGFLIAIAMRLMGERGSFGAKLRSLGLGAPSRLAANIVGALVGIGWGVLLMTSVLQYDPKTNIMAISGFRVLAALLAATGALMEDLVTRSFLMNQLHGIKVPGWAQALLAALVFAIYHTIWGFNIFAFIFSVVYGLILSGLFLWGKRSLTPVILAHSLAVLISEPFATMMIFLAP